MPTDADPAQSSATLARTSGDRPCFCSFASEDVINIGDHIGAKSQIWEVNSVINYNLRVI